ncbi:hypothetical protein CC1G_03182 [Coprinopsis cinerea okayama7|uniref:MYND-type domain-containing protein n=1 Tax=Coprinopsis cinerea (strain Okayama-7 / 130 / ATCC MYA-4618 / FGSC 9003) TaxID=240176 RepID=A8PF81_COPC7|nr:hypothetical protein CC1G_03182 [Coprinopsis cinerea okayama7\|eukprot:XP_001840953.2 hypothetical protein CC1G_03182 [Coprinopsis cinerea okayama7\
MTDFSTAKLMEQAKLGSQQAIRDLLHFTSAVDYSPSYLDILLPHFDRTKSLKRGDRHAAATERDVEFKGLLLSCFVRCAASWNRSASLRARSAEKVLPRQDDILFLMSVYTARILRDTNPAVCTRAIDLVSRSIAYLADLLDSAEDDGVLDNPRALRLTLLLWTARRRDTSQPYHSFGEQPSSSHSCSILRLLMLYARNGDEQWTALIHHITASTKSCTAFCKAYVDRVKQVPVLFARNVPDGQGISNATSAVLVDHVRELVVVGSKMAETPVLHRRLRTDGFVHHLVQALLCVRSLMSTDLRSFTGMLTITMQLSYQQYADPAGGISELLNSGVMPVFFEVILNRGHGEEEVGPIRESVFSIIDALADFMLDPRVVRDLEGLASRTPRTTWDQLMEVGRTKVNFPDFWKDFLGTIGNRSLLLSDIAAGKTSKVVSCDSHIHPQLRSTGGVTTKECSGCRSVVYCGESCQKADWAVRHRHECGIMRHSRYARESQGVKYAQRTRSFATTVILDRFLREVGFAQNIADALHPTAHESDLIAIVSRPFGACSLAVTDVMPIDDYLRQRCRMMKASCPAMDARERKVVEEHRARRVKDTVLVAGSFRYDSVYHVEVLLQVRKERSGMVVLRSVQSFLRVVKSRGIPSAELEEDGWYKDRR